MLSSERIVESTQEQAVAAWIDYLNVLRLHELAEKLEMRLGVISPEGRCSCSTAKEIRDEKKHSASRRRHTRRPGINAMHTQAKEK